MKVCDNMENTDNKGIDYVYTRKFSLSDNVLNTVCENIKKSYGLMVDKIEENDNGYVFISKHGYTIGDLTYDPHKGLYKAFNFHVGVIERETEATKKDINEYRYKKFKLQRRKAVGKLTAAALATLMAIGVIKVLPKSYSIKEQPAIVQHVNSLETADDLLLVAWANYAMGQITDKTSDSSYDGVKTQRDSLYNDYSTVMLNYYNYVDQIESGLPKELTKSLTDKYHSDFRSAAISFDNAVAKSMFSEVTFVSTPYVDATLLNTNGEAFKKGNYVGEVVGSNDEVILLDYGDTNYKVFVPADEVKNNDYSLDNLPEGAVIYNGEVYISDDYLSETAIGEPGKK